MSWYFAFTSYLFNNQHSVCPLMWPNNRIFVDSNLACPKTLGMNQQLLRLVEQFGRTGCSDICIYMFHLRDIQRRGAVPVCFYLSALLRQIPARVKSGGYRWVSRLQSVQCIGQTKKTSNSRRGKTIIIITIPEKIEVPNQFVSPCLSSQVMASKLPDRLSPNSIW